MLGYAEPTKADRIKYWLDVAIDATTRKQEVYEHLCTTLLKWDGKVINKRLWDAIHEDEWYKANGYHVWHNASTYTDYLTVEPSSTRTGQAYEYLRTHRQHYRDDNHWKEAQTWSPIIKNSEDKDGRFSFAKFQERNRPDPAKLAALQQLANNYREHTQVWNAHLAAMQHIHNTYSDAFYLLGMLFDISRDW